jgi:diguanylate cyclase (GGDEF)-like protein
VNRGSESFRVASSHLITTCATLAAISLFVVIGSQVIPGALGIGNAKGAPNSSLVTAFLLNIAIILLGWRRSKELAQTMQALSQAEQEAHRGAYVDCVTGLANRRALVTALETALGQAPDRGVLVLLDLDHFKKVNDLHGHSAGDELLSHVGRMLEQVVPGEAIVARLGGDEFAMLLPETAAGAAEGMTADILGSLAKPIEVGGFHAHVSGSAGLACLARGLGAEDVLRRADIAM